MGGKKETANASPRRRVASGAMASLRHQTAQRRGGRLRRSLAVFAVGVGALAFAGCSDEAPSQGEGDDAMAHVHALGIDPADGRLYVATHFGLFALSNEGQASKVGTAGQDTMGFTVVGAQSLPGQRSP